MSSNFAVEAMGATGSGSATWRLVSPADLETLLTVAVESGLVAPERAELQLAGLPAELVHDLPIDRRPRLQARLRLDALSAMVGAPGLDRPPLLVWMANTRAMLSDAGDPLADVVAEIDARAWTEFDGIRRVAEALTSSVEPGARVHLPAAVALLESTRARRAFPRRRIYDGLRCDILERYHEIDERRLRRVERLVILLILGLYGVLGLELVRLADRLTGRGRTPGRRPLGAIRASGIGLVALVVVGVGVGLPTNDDAAARIAPDVILAYSSLLGALIDGLPETMLADTLVSDTTLSDTTLSDTTLSDATLSDATLSDATLSDATLSDGEPRPTSPGSHRPIGQAELDDLRVEVRRSTETFERARAIFRRERHALAAARRMVEPVRRRVAAREDALQTAALRLSAARLAVRRARRGVDAAAARLVTAEGERDTALAGLKRNEADLRAATARYDEAVRVRKDAEAAAARIDAKASTAGRMDARLAKLRRLENAAQSARRSLQRDVEERDRAYRTARAAAALARQARRTAVQQRDVADREHRDANAAWRLARRDAERARQQLTTQWKVVQDKSAAVPVVTEAYRRAARERAEKAERLRESLDQSAPR